MTQQVLNRKMNQITAYLDDQIVYESVNRAWKDYRQFVKEMSGPDNIK